jgi:hypothetical protein
MCGDQNGYARWRCLTAVRRMRKIIGVRRHDHKTSSVTFTDCCKTVPEGPVAVPVTVSVYVMVFPDARPELTRSPQPDPSDKSEMQITISTDGRMDRLRALLTKLLFRRRLVRERNGNRTIARSAPEAGAVCLGHVCARCSRRAIGVWIVIVKLALVLPGGRVDGLKEAVAPRGSPCTVSRIGLANAGPTMVAEKLNVVALPAATDCVAEPVVASVKSEDAATVTIAAVEVAGRKSASPL